MVARALRTVWPALCLSVALCPAHAQEPERRPAEEFPVKIAVEPGKPEAGGPQRLVITLTIQKGYYVFANPPGKDSEGLETRVKVASKGRAREVKITYPKGEAVNVEALGVCYYTYKGMVTFEAVVDRPEGDDEPLLVRVRVRPYDDRGCRWPTRWLEKPVCEPERYKGTGMPPEGQYRSGSNHWERMLQVKRDEYVLEDFRLPDERGHMAAFRNRLCLHPADGVRARVPELIYIGWDRRSYLVEPNELISFCNAVNDGDEPRTSPSGMFLLRDADWEKEIKSKPSVPEEVRAYILSRPILAKVLEVMPYKKGVRIVGRSVLEDGYPIVVDRGRNDGMRAGMRLTWTGEYNMIIAFVTSVDDRRSTLLASWLITTRDKIEPGLVLSTRGRK
jgi:hypothetical protein